MSDKKPDITELDELPFSAIDLNNPIDVDPKKLEILKKAKEQAINDSMMKIASYDGRVQDPYPSPFLNLSDTKIPKTTTEIFRWCKYYYTFDPLIAGCINALSNFPITEIHLEDKTEEHGANESEQLLLYKKIFFKELNIYKLLIEIGIDYYLYGNCFVFGELWTNPITNAIEWKNMVRLDPSKIIIDYNPATREKKYKWQVSASLINIVKKKKPLEEYNKIPEIIKEAVIKNSALVLNSNNIYHFARPSDSMGDNTIWGTPVVANVLKLLMYRNILRQAQEAIAREHIVPMRVYYLEKTPDYNPTADWNAVAQAFAQELNKSVRDPNHKVVSPVPVNLINVGGQGRSLLLTPEIEQIQAEILAGLNVPREFIFGGVSYSGSSISLKILENQFITYRLLLKDFMQNFIIKNMAKARREWVSEKDDDSLITVKMTDLKMQDDVQQKQLVIQLNQAGKCTNEHMWKTLGIESEKMKEALKQEAIEAIDSDTEVKMKQMEAQYLLQLRQIELNKQLQDFQVSIDPQAQPEMAGGNPQQPDQTQAQGQPAQSAQPAQAPQDAAQAPQPADGKGGEDEKIKSVALQLSKVPEGTRAQFIQSLPEVYKKKVLAELQNMQQATDSSKVDMRPMPEQRPPRRNSLKG